MGGMGRVGGVGGKGQYKMQGAIYEENQTIE